eukprot:4811868-Pyramimonas_sp.AAC.1
MAHPALCQGSAPSSDMPAPRAPAKAQLRQTIPRAFVKADRPPPTEPMSRLSSDRPPPHDICQGSAPTDHPPEPPSRLSSDRTPPEPLSRLSSDRPPPPGL